ncbi:MAG TPA: amino acid adenylation domain-containing protein [Thermoanaerobaculia bacterium]|nr:amino acid adenylation domain-containing protein [Thermoanaerobaculia bacterium]
MARARQISVSELLAVAFIALVHRYTNEDDISLRLAATPSGEGIGLTCRGISADPTFLALLEQGVTRSDALPALEEAEAKAAAPSAANQLILYLEEIGAAKSLAWEFDAELCDAAAVQRMAGHFANLLAAVAADPELRISDLPFLSAAEHHALQIEWNDTGYVNPDTVCMHELIAAQVARTPGAVAVSCHGRTLSYEELNRQVNQLAHHLKKMGVGPEVLVGIFLPRSEEMVVAMLAVWKAGGAYVPLEQSYPKERLAYYLEDSAARIVLTQYHLAASLPAATAQFLYLDDGPARFAEESSEEPESNVSQDNIAYVIYTSGSTGNPKAVAIQHRNAVALVRWAREVYDLRAPAGVLACTPIGFDISVFELFVPLAYGGRVVMVADSFELLDAEIASEVTLINTAPAVLAELLRNMQLPPSVQTVNLAGEALRGDLVRRIYEQPYVAQVYNLYGPTEDTTYSTMAAIDRNDPREPAIGRPLGQGRLYVLSPQARPVPIGVVGELHLGGAGLARCYLNRPDLTAARFVPDPLATTPGARVYRTGDLARYRQDGSVDFLGRTDGQVKVRGVRIELGEIEAALGRLVGVAAYAVRAFDDQLESKRLVAYIVPEGSADLSISGLRSRLQEQLPAYMIPSAFVFLESLPLTSNGKVDRRALPPPARVRADRAEIGSAPRNNTEFVLVDIFAEALGLERVGIRENFFELGGQSLQALRVVAQVRARLGRELPAGALLGAPTVESLAALLAEGGGSVNSAIIALQPQGAKRPFFCVHPAGGAAFRFVDLARCMGEERPFFALLARGLGAADEPFSRVEEMAAYSLAAIRSVQPEGPYLVGGYSLGGLVAFEIARQLEAAGQKVALLAIMDVSAEENTLEERVDSAEIVATLASQLSIPVTAEELRGISQEEQLSYAVELGKRLGKLAPEFTPRDALRYVNIFANSFEAARTYLPVSYGGTVTVFRGEYHARMERTLGWGGRAREVEVYDIPGLHSSILEMPQVQTLSALLKASLDRAEDAIGPYERHEAGMIGGIDVSLVRERG